jgi:hypothetical protein
MHATAGKMTTIMHGACISLYMALSLLGNSLTFSHSGNACVISYLYLDRASMPRSLSPSMILSVDAISAYKLIRRWLTRRKSGGGSTGRPSSKPPWPAMRPTGSRWRSAGSTAAAPSPSNTATNMPSGLYMGRHRRRGGVDIGASVLTTVFIYFRFN